jgi:hypothetical protein
MGLRKVDGNSQYFSTKFFMLFIFNSWARYAGKPAEKNKWVV